MDQPLMTGSWKWPAGLTNSAPTPFIIAESLWPMRRGFYSVAMNQRRLIASLLPLLFFATFASADEIKLGDLGVDQIEQDWGSPQINLSVEGTSPDHRRNQV